MQLHQLAERVDALMKKAPGSREEHQQAERALITIVQTCASLSEESGELERLKEELSRRDVLEEIEASLRGESPPEDEDDE